MRIRDIHEKVWGCKKKREHIKLTYILYLKFNQIIIIYSVYLGPKVLAWVVWNSLRYTGYWIISL